jgi:hypothetical protein
MPNSDSGLEIPYSRYLLLPSSIQTPDSKNHKESRTSKLTTHRLIHAFLVRPLLHPTHLPSLLLALRSSLFPGNHLVPPTRSAPSTAEKEAIRQQCAESLLSVLPAGVASVYFGTADSREQVGAVETMLDVLGDPYCLKHFLWAVVELLLVRVLPELAEDGPQTETGVGVEIEVEIGKEETGRKEGR